MLLHAGAAHAGIHAGAHLQDIAGDVMLADILKRLDAAVQPIHRH